MTIRTILVDDEKLAIQGLQVRLEAHPDVEVIETCLNGREAIRAIKTHKPDLVFLEWFFELVFMRQRAAQVQQPQHLLDARLVSHGVQRRHEAALDGRDDSQVGGAGQAASLIG